ncbi:MAG: hypothetical protein KDC98_22545, partial [Planctomycetes bacterium]|nr:hypothetical protein [Planctomycetota bacterium]
DPAPAVAAGAFDLLSFLLFQHPAMLDTELAALAAYTDARVRLIAANRLIARQRTAEAVAILQEVARTEPDRMVWFQGWELLATHTTDPTALRETLLAAIAAGQTQLLAPLQHVAGEDPRVLELLVETTRTNGYGLQADALSPTFVHRVRRRLLALLEDPATPLDQRQRLLANLSDRDDDCGRAAVARCLGDADASLRLQALQRAAWCGCVPTAAEWQTLLADPITQNEARVRRSKFPLREDLDAVRFRGDAAIQACWAEGDPARIAELIERWFAGDVRAFTALTILRADLRHVEERVRSKPPVGLFNRPQSGHDPRLQAMLPEFAAEQRLRALDPISLCPPMRPANWQRQALLPIDAGMLAVFQRRLLATADGPRGAALQVLPWLGADGRPLLATLEQVLPNLSAEQLVLVPAAVYAIAPDAVVRICEPLLEHTDASVVKAVIAGPLRRSSTLATDAPQIRGGAAFAQRLAGLLAGAETRPGVTWFALLADGITALPALRQALREHPRSDLVARGIGDLGPAAVAAVPELVEAMGQNRSAALALVQILSPVERAALLVPLLATDRHFPAALALADLRIDGAETLAALEAVASGAAGDGTEAAKELLVRSASTSEFADTLRRQRFADASRAHHAVPLEHCFRLWPRLTAVERDYLLTHLEGSPGVYLPDAIAEALADRLESRGSDGTAFRALLFRAP